MLLEEVQILACKMILHNWNLNYHTMLSRLTLSPLRVRRQYLKLILMYNIFHNISYFHNSPIIVTNTDRHHFIKIPFISRNCLLFFFPSTSHQINSDSALLNHFLSPSDIVDYKNFVLSYLN